MNGTVSIYKHPKSNKIYLDINFNGKRKRQSTGLEKTTSNLKLVEKEVISKIQVAMANGTFSFEDKNEIALNIFDKFAESFLEIQKGLIRTTTHNQNIKIYKNHIKPHFENKIISSIKPIDLEKWQNSLIQKEYSLSTLRTYRGLFFAILDKAYKNKIIEDNPFSKVDQPRPQSKDVRNILEDTDLIEPFTEDELKVMFNFNGILGAYIYVAVFTGMRPSEMLSLDWKDIDFTNKRIAVYKSLSGGEINKTKTISSTRYVDILPNVEIKLKEWQKDCTSKTIVFPNRFNERFYNYGSLANMFKRRLLKANIKHRYLYQLRHTFASRFISRLSDGVNILWVSKMLGHKDISITLSTYTKFIKEEEEKRLINLNKMAQIWHTAK